MWDCVLYLQKHSCKKNQCHGTVTTVLFNLITIVIVIFTHYNIIAKLYKIVLEFNFYYFVIFTYY